MKRQLLLTLTLLTATFAYGATPSYSGKWTLDAAASKNAPPHYANAKAWSIDVKQDAKTLDVEVRITPPDAAEIVNNLHYPLDGSNNDTKMTARGPNGPFEVPVTLTGKAGADGTLDVQLSSELSRNGQTMKHVMAEHWSLSDEGKTLTVHVKEDGPRGAREYDVVFRKA